ncbi:MAG: hypothetical protein Q9186_002084 [Xanthomendoza sp. 1 TL-2023]
MLWNWYTVDSCFIASTWRNTTKAKFAGSCVGILCLVIILEALRRLQREYDAYLLRQHRKRNTPVDSSIHEDAGEIECHTDIEANGTDNKRILFSPVPRSSTIAFVRPQRLVPTMVQQAIRALIHTLQFGVAYFVMLTGMYYNGFMMISILAGTYCGWGLFTWEGISIADATIQGPQKEIGILQQTQLEFNIFKSLTIF